MGEDLLKTCSNSSKLRNFQFKLLHRRIATNSFLQKLGIKDTDLCTFCMKETETLTHLFWICEETCKFRTSLEHWLHSEKMLSETKEINKLSAFGLNTEPESTFLGFCTLAARYYISTHADWEKLSPRRIPLQNSWNIMLVLKEKYFVKKILKKNGGLFSPFLS